MRGNVFGRGIASRARFLAGSGFLEFLNFLIFAVGALTETDDLSDGGEIEIHVLTLPLYPRYALSFKMS